MLKQTFPLLLLVLASSLATSDKVLEKTDRDGKVFSLFSVVQFKNDPCISTTTLATGSTSNRNGTCYSTSECSNKGGSASGSCASGFGVCCVFIRSATASTINVNDTYIQNPGFPSALADTNSISYTIQKCSDDICYLRLDFEQFNLQGPTMTTEISGGVCSDMFTVTTNSGQSIPTICGVNSGEHIYIDLGALPSDTATLNFAFSGAFNSRLWDIKVAQIQCGVNYAPPNGCLQYQEGLTGTIQTFNFQDSTNNQHLAEQSYAHCIRREAGYCCIQYQLCAADNSFKLNNKAGDEKALIDTSCTLDYIGIETSTAGCNPSGTGATFVSKYCGDNLNPIADEKASVPICDCTFPFEVNIKTDNMPDAQSGAKANRGVCLEYTQVPC